MPCSMAWGKWILILELRCVNHFHVLPSMWKNPPSSPPVGCARRSHSSNWQRPLVETFYHPSLADLRAIFLVLARTLLFQPLFLQLWRAQLLFLSLNEFLYILHSFIANLVYGRKYIKTNLPYLLHKYSVSSTNWFSYYVVLVHIMQLPSFLCER